MKWHHQTANIQRQKVFKSTTSNAKWNMPCQTVPFGIENFLAIYLLHVCQRPTLVDDERASTTNVRRRRTFVHHERSSTTNVCRRRTFVDYDEIREVCRRISKEVNLLSNFDRYERELQTGQLNAASGKLALDREVFAKFREVFANVSTFSDVFERVRTCSDAFGCVGMRSDAIGCILVRWDAFGHFRQSLELFRKLLVFLDTLGFGKSI